ncbi:MAG TPA: acyl-CoA synthetase FdrA [Burkholderiales bacterium]
MPTFTRLKPNLYKDSVALMRIAEKLLQDPQVTRATLVMATPANKEILAEAGLLNPDAARANPSDLIIVVETANDATATAAFAKVDESLTAAATKGGSVREITPKTVAMALPRAAGANIAQISAPGAYAGAEALKAVKAGLNVFLFSDNVPLDQEVAVKQAARAKGLLVMGPDCGTAIIGGVPLGFANVVRRGRIGYVGASGTGLQEVTVQTHLMDEGISHAIGTGGRDVKAEVGGITMLMALDLLTADPATEVIGIVSKPPAPAVMNAVIERAGRAGKPVVVCFLGGERIDTPANVHRTGNLFDCADACVALAQKRKPVAAQYQSSQHAKELAPSQQYIRGLFSGGTFCTEAQVALRDAGVAAFSNVPLDQSRKVADLHHSQEHTVLDLGDDDFTIGRPHPMIDPSTRVARIVQEAADPETAVILLDIVLGYAGHMDPAGALVPTIRKAQFDAQAAGRRLLFVAFVCGTEEDPQVRSAQEAKLLEAGCILGRSSTEAARMAAALVA